MTHPHLVRAYELVERPQPVLVLESLTGATLGYLIDSRASRLPHADLVYLGLQLCSAVRYLHTFGVLHLDLKPANIFLMLVPFAPNLTVAVGLLLARGLLSQMDVPTRTSYVMAVVTPSERPAAASATAVPRSLAAALSPMFAGYLFSLSTFGWPLIIGGALKVTYDILLLLRFKRIVPPDEA